MIQHLSKRGFIWGLFFALFVVVLAILTINLKEHENLAIQAVSEELKAVAKLKSDEINAWRKERITDGVLIGRNSKIAKTMNRLNDSTYQDIQNHLQPRINHLLSVTDYVAAHLIDKDNNLIVTFGLETPSARNQHHVAFHDSIEFDSRKPVLTLLQKHKNSPSHMMLVLPLTNDGKYVGTLVLHLEPDQVLFPLVYQWPGKSPSAEIVLHQVEGLNFSPISRSRHGDLEPLGFRKPLQEKPPFDRLWLESREEIIHFTDRRGVKSIGYFKRIKDSPWFIVAKVNAEEVVAPERQQFYLVLITLFISFLTSAIALYYWLRRRDIVELRESYERQALLMDSVAEAIYGLDSGGNCTFVNTACLELLGYTNRSEILGKNIHDLIHHTDVHGKEIPYHACRAGSAFREGHKVHVNDEVFWKKNGQAIPVEYWAYPLYRSGQLTGSVVTFFDISERQRAEKALLESEDRLRKVVEHMPVILSAVDEKNNILVWNREAEKISGYKADEMINNPAAWENLYPDLDYRQSVLKEWQNPTSQRNHERRLLAKDRSAHYVEWSNISATYPIPGWASWGTGIDVTERKVAQDQLNHLAHHDPLTDLPNRLLLNERLAHSIRRAQRNGSQLAVIFLDLDNFKHINDSLGHPVGDNLLQAVSSRMLQVMRQEDTVAHIGGDEFVLILEDIETIEGANLIAQKLLTVFDVPFQLEASETCITASMGISIFPTDGEDTATLLRNADAAMYEAKSVGCGTYHFYTKELTEKAVERVSLSNGLQKAIDNNELMLLYQPQVDLHNHKVVGLEALLRWQHPELGVVSPAKFIPLAEETGLIHSIGYWVLETAARQAKIWIASGLEFGAVAVNVSGRQFQTGNLVSEVELILTKVGLPAENLELEVTESFIMQQQQAAITQLNELRMHGLSLAIDDFGTGYSSLSYLKRFPIHKLKIDQSFVHDLPSSPDDAAISNAIIALSKSLGLTTIAEGVETEEQAKFLAELGCREAQGYFYSRPLTAEQAEDFCKRSTN